MNSDEQAPVWAARVRGLRERRRTRTKHMIQTEALRLFAEQGYERTTVDDIAHAAAISPRTFFRYFPTKEDVVLWDEYDELELADEIWRNVGDETPIAHLVTLIRYMMTDLYQADPDRVLARVKLGFAVPEIRARFLDQQLIQAGAVFDQLVRILGGRTDDVRLRASIAALFAAIMVAVERWQHDDGRDDVGRLFDEAVAAIADSADDLRAVLPPGRSTAAADGPPGVA